MSRCAIRAETVHLWTKFGSFGLTLNDEQIPQIVKNKKNQGGRETSWKDFFCAQGRCANLGMIREMLESGQLRILKANGISDERRGVAVIVAVHF
jgi:hypothetical protein